MPQLNLGFGEGGNLLPCDGELRYYPRALPADQTPQLLQRLEAEIDWRQEQVTVMGRTLPAPRLTAWYGDQGYVYSGVRHAPRPMPDLISVIRVRAEALAAQGFNAVLMNLYRHGGDSVSWHADNEPSLGRNPVIASVSLGETRKFQLKHRRLDHRINLELDDGSMVIMGGTTQHHWLHQIPKTKQTKAMRINLTFRHIGANPAS
ncbi:MAG: alpha-ketoglutarate-dependent dioxygenase AlkB [Pseudomonadota bacterium]